MRAFLAFFAALGALCAAPLQAFLSVHGVARFASHAWRPVDASNQRDLLMHLSNSSINQVAEPRPRPFPWP